MLPKLILKTGKIKSIKRYHPWVFSGAIKKIEGNPQNGDIVEIFSNHDEYLASGHYQEGTIAVRIFSFNRVTPDYEFWKSKIYNAYKLRDSLNLVSNKLTNAYRLVFAEGDELPGLVIDFYNGVAVIQCHSVGMHNIIQDISQILQDIYKEKIIAIYDKSQNSLPTMNNNTYENKFLYGNIPNTTILENGFKFIVDFVEGQKTGFFIDQRENRTLIRNYSKDRKVLNLFSYTGAFSIYAAGSGAKFIYSVDSSAKAIDMAKKNMEINGFSTVSEEIQTDVMEYLQNTNEKYDLIILDPPAFAKHNDARHNAIQGYTRLNAEAIKKLNHNGILFTFSCSQLVDRQLFNSAVMAAAIQSGRKIKILHQLSQPPDHPYSIFHPEGHYLKGLVLMAN